MLITTIEVENWKSYGFAKIPLSPGVTAILGENGSGKSSILEAVGFTLFDHRNGKLSDLLREGAKSGRVIVSLASSRDGTEYVVEREFTAKTTTRYRVHQVEQANQIVAEGVAAVQQWLRTHMGVPPDAQLATLFANTIGVPQGTFTAPFLLPSAQRKAVFDPLLRVEEYRKASDNLRPTVRQLKDEKVALDTEIARMGGELTMLPGLREEGKDLGYDLARLGTVQALRKQQLSNAETKLKGLDKAAKLVEETERRAGEVLVRLDAHEDLCESALQTTEEAEKAAQVVEENLSGHQAYLEAEKTLQSLDTRRSIRDSLLREQTEARVKLARYEAAKAREGVCQEEADQARERVREVQHGLAEAASIGKVIQELDADIKQAQGMSDELMRSMGSVQAIIDALSKQNGLLVDADIAACPTCGTELTPQHREELLARNHADMQRHDDNLAKLTETVSALSAQIKTAHNLQHSERRKLRSLPGVAELTQAKAVDRRRRSELAALRLEIGQVADVQDRVNRLGADLALYAGLDALLSHFQEQRRGHEEAHSLYLGHSQLAQLYPERQAVLDELLVKRQELKRECGRLAEQWSKAAAAYDAEEHTELQGETSALQQKLASVQAQLKEKRYRLTVVKDSIERLEATEKELAAKTALATETTDLLATIETVRDILREAGPYVIRRLVRQISASAATMFGDLMGDPGRRLQWSEDYEVLLDGRGHSRTFAQLSGGEQMVAALAVRLALLRETSTIDVAFFDEPTAHLDPERRESLAASIAQVKGLSQLFVISHDATFESAAENTIRIVKDEAGSHCK